MIESMIRYLALRDLEHHQKHGVDLNPFSTDSLRTLWQKGWDGQPLPQPNHEHSPNWRAWERGRQARLLAEKEP